MLKCPACGRAGGPFRLRHQIQADSQILRSWACPCGTSFHATAGAERTASSQPPYSGFALEWNGRPQQVRLLQMGKHETNWQLGVWSIIVAGPPNGPGTRTVSLYGTADDPLGEWRLEPTWGPVEIGRRLRTQALPAELDPDLLARVLVRLMG